MAKPSSRFRETIAMGNERRKLRRLTEHDKQLYGRVREDARMPPLEDSIEPDLESEFEAGLEERR